MTEFAAAPASPRDTLGRLLFGYQISQGILVAARLGLADLLIERLILPGDATSAAMFTDMDMLVLLGGRERTEAKYADLLAGVGLRLTRVLPTASPYASLEARRAE